MKRLNQLLPLEGVLSVLLTRRNFLQINALAKGPPISSESSQHPEARIPDDGQEPRQSAVIRDHIVSLRQLGEGLLDRIVRVEAITANVDAESIYAIVIRAHQH